MGKCPCDMQIWKDLLRCENHKLRIYVYLTFLKIKTSVSQKNHKQQEKPIYRFK